MKRFLLFGRKAVTHILLYFSCFQILTRIFLLPFANLPISH